MTVYDGKSREPGVPAAAKSWALELVILFDIYQAPDTLGRWSHGIMTLFDHRFRLWLAALIAVFSMLSHQAVASGYDQLLSLSQDWRGFVPPPITQCVPDYGAAAIKAKATGLKAYRQRLSAIDRTGWTPSQSVDYRVIEAEMQGLDFDLRILRPWARDPTFYATLFDEESDVPVHEGSSAEPQIDLFAYSYPLSDADQKRLTCLIGAIPALLNQAKINLAGSNTRDLWLYGARAFREQSRMLAALEAGTLTMRTLSGPNHGSLDGVGAALRQAVHQARDATDKFQGWVTAEAPSKTGPSGVGKENYNWYEKNVHLVPFDWDSQATLLQRELDRALAALRLEELHNQAEPPLAPHDDGAAWPAFSAAKMQRLTDFLIHSGIVPDRPYFRDAMARQALGYTPPDQRNFFGHGIARDPLGLYSHDYHWIELARLKFEPNPSPIRRLPILWDMFDTRSEGLATAMEELLLQAGLYDGDPRGREIVWCMLANRAARGLASLYVQANQMSLAEAGQFHAHWTPRGWSDPSSDLVAFEQLLYLRQPGYGTSYVIGKLQFDHLIALASHQAETDGREFSVSGFFERFNQAGILPFSLIEIEMAGGRN